MYLDVAGQVSFERHASDYFEHPQQRHAEKMRENIFRWLAARFDVVLIVGYLTWQWYN